MATVNRLSYFEGALELLAKEGFSALRVTVLCRSLGMTTGSFYNWFDGWDDFVELFLAHWERDLTHRLVEQAGNNADPWARLDELRALARSVPHDAEVALRAWSSADPRAARVCAEVDRLRHRMIFDTVHSLVSDVARAEQLAGLGLSIFIGQQHVDSDGMDWSLAQFIALVRVHADIA